MPRCLLSGSVRDLISGAVSSLGSKVGDPLSLTYRKAGAKCAVASLALIGGNGLLYVAQPSTELLCIDLGVLDQAVNLNTDRSVLGCVTEPSLALNQKRPDYTLC